MIEVILVGFDGSDEAMRAVEHAARIAGASCPLHVVGVIQWSLFGAGTGMDIEAVKRNVAELGEVFRRDKLDPLIAILAGNGIKAFPHLEDGRVVEGLLDVAQRVGATNIVVGRPSHGKLSAILLGSTSLALIQSSPVPVTVVP